jgi:hypothetical protein
MEDNDLFQVTSDNNNCLLMDASPSWSQVTITTKTGKELVIGLEGDTITVAGDAELDAAAEEFFNYALRGIVDNYIKGEAK